jgi:hypothetical protein
MQPRSIVTAIIVWLSHNHTVESCLVTRYCGQTLHYHETLNSFIQGFQRSQLKSSCGNVDFYLLHLSNLLINPEYL